MSEPLCNELFPSHPPLAFPGVACTLPAGHPGDEHRSVEWVGDGDSGGQMTLTWNPKAIAALKERVNRPK